MNDEEIEEIEEKEVCACCGEEFPEGTLIETEGMLHGGIGRVCEQCLEDYEIK